MSSVHSEDGLPIKHCERGHGEREEALRAAPSVVPLTAHDAAEKLMVLARKVPPLHLHAVSRVLSDQCRALVDTA